MDDEYFRGVKTKIMRERMRGLEKTLRDGTEIIKKGKVRKVRGDWHSMTIE